MCRSAGKARQPVSRCRVHRVKIKGLFILANLVLANAQPYVSSSLSHHANGKEFGPIVNEPVSSGDHQTPFVCNRHVGDIFIVTGMLLMPPLSLGNCHGPTRVQLVS